MSNRRYRLSCKTLHTFFFTNASAILFQFSFLLNLLYSLHHCNLISQVAISHSHVCNLKKNETKTLYLALLLVLLHLHMLNIGFLSHFSFSKTLFPSFLHHLCLQFLYPTNFLVRECFSLLVIIIMGQCPTKSPFWGFFQVFNFFDFLSTPKSFYQMVLTHPKLDYPS